MSFRHVVALSALVLFPSVAAAEANEMCAALAKIEQSALQFDDVEYNTKILYNENNKVVKTFRIKVVTKGTHKTLVSFEAGDMRGTRVLILDAETMYSYLPDFGRVRRIAGHSRRQSFMGTNLYYEDITERRYSTRWACTPHKTTDDQWIMNLRPKAGAKSAYTKVRLFIDREQQQIDQIEYFEETRHIKSQFRESWKTMNGITRASVIRFVSHDQNADLRVEYTDWRANTGVPDSAFTRRALLRGI